MAEPLRFPIETCAGCGATAHVHPIVGIMSDGSNGWRSVPVCHECWTDPAHRSTPLKAHFFRHEEREIALAHAGSSDLG